MVFAPTNCLVVTAFILSLISWVCGIIALAFPDWLVIEASDTKTRIGAFKICDDQLGGGGNASSTSLFSSSLSHGECQSVSATAFSFGGCERGSSDIAARFGVVQGLGIVAIVLGVVSTALLIASYSHGLYLRGAAANKAAYVTKGKNGRRGRADGFNEIITTNESNAPYSGNHTCVDAADAHQSATDAFYGSVAPSEPSRAPTMEIIAFVSQLISVGASAVSSFYYLTTVESWLFCGSKPCAHVMSSSSSSGVSDPSGNGVVVGSCRSGYGWAYALSFMMWIAGIFALIALLLRWLLRNPLPEGAEGLSRDAYTISLQNRSRGLFPAHNNSNNNEEDESDSENYHRSRRLAPTSAAAQTYYEGGVGEEKAHGYGSSSASKGINTTPQSASHPAVTHVHVVNAPLANVKSENNENGNSPFRARVEGEPECDLPEGVWEWDAASQLFWSEEQQYFFDHNSGHFYEPESGQWYNPLTDQWYTL